MGYAREYQTLGKGGVLFALGSLCVTRREKEIGFMTVVQGEKVIHIRVHNVVPITIQDYYK